MTEKMRTRKVVELVEDMGIYPRVRVDSYHTNTLRHALQAGAELPPIIVEEKSNRIVDGFHRRRAYQDEYGDEHEVAVIARTYASEKELFEDAVRLNASHGRALSAHDRARVFVEAEKKGASREDVAKWLHITLTVATTIVETKLGRVRVTETTSEPVPIKRTIRHMAGKTLTEKQNDVVAQLGGMSQVFYANQLILLIQTGLLDTANETLVERLTVLHGQLTELLARLQQEAATSEQAAAD